MNQNKRISNEPSVLTTVTPYIENDYSSTTSSDMLDDSDVSTSDKPFWKDEYYTTLPPTLDGVLSQTTIDYHTTKTNPRGEDINKPAVLQGLSRGRPGMAVKDMYMAENTPRFVVAFTSPVWRKAKDLEGEKCFVNFLRQYAGWKNFWQLKDITTIKYFPLCPLPGKISYKNVISMKLVDEEWMTYVEAEADIGPKDLDDADLVDAIAKFCEKKKDWTSLFI